MGLKSSEILHLQGPGEGKRGGVGVGWGGEPRQLRVKFAKTSEPVILSIHRICSLSFPAASLMNAA